MKMNNPIRYKSPEFFFQNRDCPYFPCHTSETAEFNCKFCYCPLFFMKNCGGSYTLLDGKKNCCGCDFPHRPENLQLIIEKLAGMMKQLGAGYEI
ncbi:MAG: cysteine-rich small domain-containing protein [Victivallaceae bacterium]|nr:cysteine-rich small domain-containing protein [Victivallaceae bacterium]